MKLGEQASAEPADVSSVIKLNSTYLELVDRWYPVRGFAAWQGAMILLLGLVPFIAFLSLAIEDGDAGGWVFFLLTGSVLSFFIWAGWKGMRFDIFRMTHYPIRLNRKTRQVHVTRPFDTVLTVSWDELFICVHENDLPLFGRSIDVRAHVLASDRETVLDTFTLAYSWLGGKDVLMMLWEYIRRYMEEQDGVESNYYATGICVPVDGRREGFVYGLVRTFVPYPKEIAPYANWAILQLLFSPIWALTTLGRWLAMSTSKVPVWPAEVEAVCRMDPDDPYGKDWRSNGRYDFDESGWPAVCFVVGLAGLAAGFWALLSVVM
ncbi:hypothetical protein CO641_04155 [Lysobacteraceae bacterium NML91-0213]|nr:hypothetical protein CO641_04155 [Xanthomonadaceae bacterium NML91-0213]